jgi:hypothetical protein
MMGEDLDIVIRAARGGVRYADWVGDRAGKTAGIS